MNDGQMEWAQEAPTKTLRDEFAMAALNAMLSKQTGSFADENELATASYQMADAMMKAREVGS